jgi:hypothetical protein
LAFAREDLDVRGQPRPDGVADKVGKKKLGIKVKGREMIGEDGRSYALRESPAAHKGILGNENEDLRLENAYSWGDSL